MKILDLLKRVKSSPEQRAAAQLNRYIRKAEAQGIGGLFKAAMIGITDVPIAFTKADRVSAKGLTVDTYKQVTASLGDFDVWIAKEKNRVEAAKQEETRKRRRNTTASDIWEEYYEVHDERGWRKNHKDYGSIVSSKISGLPDEVQDYLEKKMIKLGNKLRQDRASESESQDMKNAILDAKSGMSLKDLKEKYGYA
jgi:hypothetical protein